MKNKVKGLLFRIPTMLLLLGGFGGSAYATLNNMIGPNGKEITWGPAIIFLVILILYFVGEYFSMKEDSLFGD